MVAYDKSWILKTNTKKTRLLKKKKIGSEEEAAWQRRRRRKSRSATKKNSRADRRRRGEEEEEEEEAADRRRRRKSRSEAKKKKKKPISGEEEEQGRSAVKRRRRRRRISSGSVKKKKKKPIGGEEEEPCSKSFWNPVVKRIEDRLAPWKRKLLSKAGRVVLIKSVLATFFMSVFKMPVGVAHNIERLQRNFLWGDGIEKRKLHAVDWNSVCKSEKKGGLGIGRMLNKNDGMLAKWVWRFGREDSPYERRCCEPSMELINIKCYGIGKAFPRIFALATAKSWIISNFGSWVGTSWRWQINLRRQPFDWEKDQWYEFLSYLDRVPIRSTIKDSIAWNFCSKGLFTVGSFRKTLEELDYEDQW
ncbi:hypothetical protein Dsin_032738 [Dipteronia sinensis]|uniref:Uncharacterized protein n=1 Tax=Dipteronia sinensis TaxID=43782 RepID=A0AAE0DQ52_9ROSI|nr:hypothetical protein Dsin_032738 [Dipteronia sinensis]